MPPFAAEKKNGLLSQGRLHLLALHMSGPTKWGKQHFWSALNSRATFQHVKASRGYLTSR